MSNCPFNWTIKLSWHAYWLIVPFGDERQQRYSCPFCSLYLFCQQQFKIMVHTVLWSIFSESPWSRFFLWVWLGSGTGSAQETPFEDGARCRPSLSSSSCDGLGKSIVDGILPRICCSRQAWLLSTWADFQAWFFMICVWSSVTMWSMLNKVVGVWERVVTWNLLHGGEIQSQGKVRTGAYLLPARSSRIGASY